MLKVEETTLAGVLLIHFNYFEDHRGEYVETYNEKEYREAGIEVKFVQDDYSMSTKGVLRGIHGDNETWKLISCPFGKFYLVVVNCDESSQSFGKWEAFVLSDRNKKQVLVPAKYGNGHLILSDIAIFSYKQSRYYDPGIQFSYRWNEPRFNIWWPTNNPILSRRDEVGHYV
ncbi:MAG: dTDP-4-dehydrorhamnose 3,5-epimerase family protein [bacterium]